MLYWRDASDARPGRTPQRELDFHFATRTAAEHLALAALQDRDLSDAERYAWRERRDAARRGLARG